MKTIRLTAAQAMARFLAAQKVEIEGRKQRLFEGVFALFGHGNVAGFGEALYADREALPTYRAHNEQAMAHAAIAFAKASRRKRMMACTTSIGPGATNMVTAAAVAHVNRLPVLLIPADVFANRKPDPVLQQMETFGDGTVSANDCFRPVSRYFDRIIRPEQIVPALNRAIAVLTDPAECGPVTLAFCQDVQTEAYDYPEAFFARANAPSAARRPGPARGAGRRRSLQRRKEAVGRLRRRRALFRGRAGAGGLLRRAAAFRSARPRPASQPLRIDHPFALGAIGVTGTGAANALAAEADVIVGVGTRLRTSPPAPGLSSGTPTGDSSGSTSLPFDAAKHRALPIVGDARVGAGRARRRPRRWQRAVRLGRPRGRGQGRMGDGRRPLHGSDKRRLCRATRKCSAR